MKAAGSSKKAGGKPPVGRPFRKGQSGNPAGRAAVPADVREEVRAILHAGTVPAAKALVDIVATSDDENARIKAASIILDRVMGKAAAAIEDREAMKNAAAGLVVGIRDMARLSDDDVKRLEDIATRARPDSQP